MIVSSLGPVRYVLFLKRPHHLSSQRVSWTVWMTDGMEAFIQSIHSTVKHGCNVLQVINYNNRWLRCQMYRMSSLITKSRLMPLRWRAAGKIKSQFAQGTKIKNKRGTERMPPHPHPQKNVKTEEENTVPPISQPNCMKQLQARKQRWAWFFQSYLFLFQWVPFSVTSLSFQPIYSRQEQAFRSRRRRRSSGSRQRANIEIRT